MPITAMLLASPLRGRLDNRPELELPYVAGETVATFLDRLFQRYPMLRSEMMVEARSLLYEYQVWHNEEMVRDDGFERALKDGDTVGLLLPISGGAAPLFGSGLGGARQDLVR
ncbi:MAG: MoaD/ThiS family protein [Candidatus Rokuibacteriota bacterium]